MVWRTARFHGTPAALAMATFLFAAVLSTFLVLRSEQGVRQQRRIELTEQAADKAFEIEHAVERALTATYALAALVRQGHGNVANFEEVGAELIPFYPGADSLQLAPGGIIRRIVPLAGSERALGHDLLADPARNKEAFLARDTGRLTLAGPFELMQGGIGAVGRLPVFIDDASGTSRFWGFVTVLIRFPEALSAAQLPQLAKRGVDYELWRTHPDTGSKQVIARSSDNPLDDPVNRDLKMPNGVWTLSVAPTRGWGNAPGLGLKGVLGAAFSLLLAWLAKQMLELKQHREGLQSLVAERTAEVNAREAKLSALIASLPDLLFVIDDTGRITELNCPDDALLPHPPSQFLGRRYAESLPPDVAHRFDEVLALIRQDGRRREIEYGVDFPGGSRQFSASISPLAGDVGVTAGFIALVRDVTERKLAEERMREAMVVFDASSQGIMTADEHGVILSVNPAFSSISGFSAADVVGRTPSIFKSGRHESAFYKALWSTLNSTDRWEGEIWNRRKNGDVYPQWLTISAVRDARGKLVKYVSLFSDITRRKQREEVIWRQANFDALTGLANRNLLHDRLERTLAHSRRNGKKAGLIFLDLDGFKWINDTLGHDFGDQMLVEVARRLQKCVREQDTVARLGGDEFTLVVGDLEDAGALQTISDKVLKALREPFAVAGADRHISGSLGITVFPDDGEDVQTLLRNADIAMYQSKQLGKNRMKFYAAYMQESAHARMRLEVELRAAVERNDFVLYYQPIVDARTGGLVGAEALLRWVHPERGIVPPNDFIPVAEDTGLIVPIGEWVLREATLQSRRWRAQGFPRLRIAVNVSGVQFREPGLLELINRLQIDHDVDRSNLILEITESVLIESSETAEARMREIELLGVGYSLDDFGTGFSSLSYLKRFPVEIVKIDRSFVRDCPEDRNDALLVEAIINMTHSLGLRVTAEGVETDAQRDFLQAMGCDYLQGYLIGEPMPAERFEALIQGEVTAS